jgi:hypothetical protein
MLTPPPNIMPRVLFARIGRMHNYAGPVPGDDRPIGGGGHNKTNIGHEVYNFKPTSRRLYGYFQPNMASQSVALERIDPAFRETESIDNVLLIFIARLKEGGQAVVGWYRNAEIHRYEVKHSPGKPRGFGHYAVADLNDCVLLPDANRRWEVPNGKGGTGQSNVCYPFFRDGAPKKATWMLRIVKSIENYKGTNLLVTPEADAEADSLDAIEKAIARAQGQGFARNPEQRRALEDHSMARAKQYYERAGYTVTDVSKQKPYDFECVKGEHILHVEVKGTTTDGKTIVLTKNEVQHATNSKTSCALFVLHSIKLKGKKAIGGTPDVHDPWDLVQAKLTPISYTYRIERTSR